MGMQVGAATMKSSMEVPQVFDKGSKNVQWRKDNLFNEQCQGNCTAICKRIKLEHFVTPYKKETQNGLQT